MREKTEELLQNRNIAIFDPTKSRYKDDYWGRINESFVLYNPINLIYTNRQLEEMKNDISQYMKTKQTSLSNEQLWHMHYALKSNMHPETGKPIPKLFRWSAYCPVNIPIIIGLSVLPPTPFNQILFQTINQSYNFGINFCNSTASNKKSNTEIAVSFCLAVSSAILGSVGLKKLLEKSGNSVKGGRFYKLLMQSTPLVGLVAANSVNLLFSRSGELMNGIAVNNPIDGSKIEGVTSKKAGRKSFLDSLALRVAIPAPCFFIPLLASRFAKRRFSFYQTSKVMRMAYDGTVAYFTIWSSLVVAMSFVDPVGEMKLEDLEPEVSRSLPGLDPSTFIRFNKGI